MIRGTGEGGQRRRSIGQVVRFTTLMGGVLSALPAAAQTVQTTTAHIVEWDLPATADSSPGAMVVDPRGDDQNRLWFVTRLGVPRVFRVSPFRSLMKGPATWTSWELALDSFTTGGTKKIKASHDRRFVWVRTAESLQRIDTQNCDTASPQTCQRIEWFDQPGQFNVSDLSVDDYNNVFTTAAVGGDPFASPIVPPPSLGASYVQMLPTPGFVPANMDTGSVTVTRWTVGGGAGFCADLGRSTTSFPCVSGIAASPTNRNLVYYSEPEGGSDGRGAIGELNISTNTVRRWAFTTLPLDADGVIVQQPRQLHIDRWGAVWVNTGSGHLVSLNPSSNQMGAHAIPSASLADPFGIAPDDDVVGYTDAGINTARVGMMFPKGPTITVSPTTQPNVPHGPVTVTTMGERATVASGSQAPRGSVVTAQITTKPDGVFVDAFVGAFGGHDSESPLGITPNKGKGQGSFFYAVGLPGSSGAGADRVGMVRLPMPQKVRHPRDDDDGEDGWDHSQHPSGWHMSGVDDDDNDGLENEYDSPTAQENVTVLDPTIVQAGQTKDYPMTASSTSLALIALAVAESDPTAFLSVDILNSAGQLVATSPVTAGLAAATLLLPAAGDYTARVHNQNVTGAAHTPKLIVREPWQP
jgi:hypothetical protein